MISVRSGTRANDIVDFVNIDDGLFLLGDAVHDSLKPWIYVSAIGALPFVISGEIPFYIDALFETTSGFSTTGATILTGEQIENMSISLLFWRSFRYCQTQACPI